MSPLGVDQPATARFVAAGAVARRGEGEATWRRAAQVAAWELPPGRRDQVELGCRLHRLRNAGSVEYTRQGESVRLRPAAAAGLPHGQAASRLTGGSPTACGAAGAARRVGER